MPRGKLTDKHRDFLVRRLACFDTPKEAADALFEEFGMEVTPQSAQYYDPTKYHHPTRQPLAKKWTDLFHQTRETFVASMETEIPEANKAVRVKHLAHAARVFKSRNNYVGMADMLEKIAKEVGNVHTNRKEITGRDGKPVEFADMSDAELDQSLGAIFGALGFAVVNSALSDDEDAGEGDAGQVH